VAAVSSYVCLFNKLEVDNESASDAGDVEDVSQSIPLMIRSAIDPDDSRRLHLLAILCDNLPRGCNQSRDDQDLHGVNCGGAEQDQTDV
jgi:hypothetical protein